MTTREQILDANKAGLEKDYVGFYTPILRVAHKLGCEGIDLSSSPVITAFRYGKAPESFLSMNYRDGNFENGLSVYARDSVQRPEFMDRKIYYYTGIVSGKGGDGETLILAFEAEYLD